MKPRRFFTLFLMAAVGPAAHAADGDSNAGVTIGVAAHGKYLYDAADCAGCHGGGRTGTPPGGGRALATPFGTFYAPNISADPRYGIGGWSEAQFRDALRRGIAPGGKQLFPVFPFPSFSGLTDQDISDIRAYVLSLPAVPDPDKPHQIRAPFGWRPMMAVWRALFFRPGPLAAVAGKSDEWNRGNYLVHAVAHCEECHTPRNVMGALRGSRAFSGNIGGPDGQNAPNITSDSETGIGTWTIEEITHLLKTGETPDFDSVASGMAEVIRGTKMLTDDDRHAMAVYLKSVPPIHTARRPPDHP
ncbi:cytochrome c [Telmatospirillum sp.]|uniref:cytochrome c n=1 Tax=Telmatospirillum sp. TaxID=2079197 RepID=UPI002847C9A0|nr:cytochrome c [Telmatospirillum sp.]MDR3437047.1 cytochrome c [Telmatospirillum sp.]